jgi:anaerobic magnesium-protoporphyrin IX monomethyl ester cyclase
MRILLIRPPASTFNVSPPIGLGYLATALRRDGHVAGILDCTKEEMTLEGFRAYLKSSPPWDIYGFQTYSCEVGLVRQCLQAVRDEVPAAVRIIGGAHPSGALHCLDELSNADFAFLGEAETSLPLFCAALGGSASPKWESVPGLVWRENGRLRSSARYAEPQLDKLSFPAWDLIDPRTYPAAPHGGFARRFPVAPLIISRGCPYSCTFCGTKNVTGMKMRYRSPENVIEEIRLLERQYGVREIHVEDDNFSAVRREVKKFCETMVRENVTIPWYCTSGLRLDLIDEEIAGLMHKAGCYTATIAIESASQRTLNHMKKNLNLAKVPEHIRILRNAGFTLNALFILGYPTETRADVEETIRYAMKLDVQRAQFSNFLPIPGTEAYEYVKQRGEIDNLDFDQLHTADIPYSPPGMTRRELKWLQRKAFLRFHLRPHVLWNTFRDVQSFSHLRYLARRIGDYIFVRRRAKYTPLPAKASLGGNAEC